MKPHLVKIACCFLSAMLSIPLAQAKCTDSDGGKNPAQSGQVLFEQYKDCDLKKSNECLAVSSLEKDFCKDSSRLKEYWCEGESLQGETLVCPRGCAESRCK